MDVLIRILPFQVDELRDDQGSGDVVDLIGQHDNAVVEQAGEYIVAAFAAAGLFNNIRN